MNKDEEKIVNKQLDSLVQLIKLKQEERRKRISQLKLFLFYILIFVLYCLVFYWKIKFE